LISILGEPTMPASVILVLRFGLLMSAFAKSRVSNPATTVVPLGFG
jgi:hypothetical protein